MTSDAGVDSGVDASTSPDAGTCDAPRVCGSACCQGAEVCSFERCLVPGDLCADHGDCAINEYCESSAAATADVDGGTACPGGGAPTPGRCIPLPPSCGPSVPPAGSRSCIEACEVAPAPGAFSTSLRASWGSPTAPLNADSVIVAPVVIQLDDDNCDGTVDARDVPEIVFTTFASSNYNGDGTVHAISLIDGVFVQKWSANAGATSPNHPARALAAGDIDGVAGNEVVVCTTDGFVRAYRGDGSERWLSQTPTTCRFPSIADLDQDGVPEVITEGAILDGATGNLELVFNPVFDGVIAVDVTGDGRLDLVGPQRVISDDGTTIVDTGVPGSSVAVANLDGVGLPEIVTVHFLTHSLSIWRVDTTAPGNFVMVRAAVDINGSFSPTACVVGSPGNNRGGGAPAVADFNGDGHPDVGVAGGLAYAVFDGAALMNQAVGDSATLLWGQPTQDCSSATTGSSAFDFDGDGSAEVVYADETTLHVYDGATGASLFSTCNTSGTLSEYPLVADVDADGYADLVVPSNSYSGISCTGTKTSGVRVFGSAGGDWARTRPVWNEFAFHGTNVEDDGTIPRAELPHFDGASGGAFRSNSLEGSGFGAPDLVVTVAPVCAGTYGLVARVRNLGSGVAPAGVPVSFYSGMPGQGATSLAVVAPTTSRRLYPMDAEDVILPLTFTPMATETVFAVVDESAVHVWQECRTTNNVSDVGSAVCVP